MAINIKKDLKQSRDLSYLNKDFNNFRSDLLEYAKIHYSDNISDFSEAGLGGLFLDMAAYVGDVMSFYLDHQFSELSLETATEDSNIEQLIKDAGVKIRGASPSFCEVDVIFSVDSTIASGIYKPNRAQLPVIKQGTIFTSINGVNFEVVEDVDFAETDRYGKLKADIAVDALNTNRRPLTYLVKRSVTVSSGETTTEKFTIGGFTPFRTITLSNSDVSEIIFVTDSNGNKYYEVESLAHDVVFIANPNLNHDEDKSEFSLTINPAPRRFITESDFESGQLTLRFGSGRSAFEDEDVIQDPTDYALPLFGERKNFSINAVDPNNLIESNTLGIVPRDTVLTVQYRHGGGLSHNVRERTIISVKTLVLDFPITTSAIVQNSVRNSITVSNSFSAKGGESRPSLEELRTLAFNARTAQSRIVNVQDLLYRVYTMPTKFGRVFRLGVSKNPVSNSILIHVVARDDTQKLSLANDTLKDNISVYLNQYRLISDSYDIVDARIVNLSLEYIISVERGFNSNDVISRCNGNLVNFLDTKNFDIDKPINLTDVNNIIMNTEGVLTIASSRFINRSGFTMGRSYSDVMFSPLENTRRQQLFPPAGGIFEIKFPDSDIRGAVI